MQPEENFVPAGYAHCPLCEVLVNNTDLVNHIRHSGCRLYKARERKLIATGHGKIPCPVCNKSVAIAKLREHLQEDHTEQTQQPCDDRLFSFGANRPVGG